MASNYPGSIDSWTDKVDRVDIYMADHINSAYLALIAIQQTLGVNPQASFATVAARIATLAVPVTPFLQLGTLTPDNVMPLQLNLTLGGSVA